jgi:hypothetical protein
VGHRHHARHRVRGQDTDRDGLPDNYEIFGEGIYDYDDFVPDEDKDALIAARDHDDNNDKINDGRLIDTDGDTIPNYLEYYGYVYDWLTGRFVSCEDVDCTGQTVYKTDPLQRSTDQDPYSDDVEASGLNMDVSVLEPGVHPLVPACPSLEVELAAYSVTLNENITYGRGGSISQGTTWTRETTRSHSQTTEQSWDIGITLGIGFEGKTPTGMGQHERDQPLGQPGRLGREGGQLVRGAQHESDRGRPRQTHAEGAQHRRGVHERRGADLDPAGRRPERGDLRARQRGD